MKVEELIGRLQAMPRDLEVRLMFDRIGVLPVADVKRMGTTMTRVQPGGFVEIDPGKLTFEVDLIAHTPESWRLESKKGKA